MRVATLNVNGIRAAGRRGLGRWLEDRNPDLLLLQEVRASADQLAAAVPGWSTALDAGGRAGRNGVAVLTRTPPLAVRAGFGRSGSDTHGFEAAGRWLEVDVEPGLTAVSVYVPTGGTAPPVQDTKHRFLDAVTARMSALRAAADAGGRQVVVGGDLNVAAEQADIRAWRANLKHSGFLPAEREWLRGLLADGWTDLVRAAHPDVAGPYSWWSWRGQAFDTDAGWRIDLLLATAGLAAGATAAWVDRAPTYAERLSDHAPVLADLERPPPGARAHSWPARSSEQSGGGSGCPGRQRGRTSDDPEHHDHLRGHP